MRGKLITLNSILVGVIAVLVISLIFSVITIVDRNNHIKEMESQSVEASASISESDKLEKELREKLEKSESEKADIKAKLEASENEKNRLESENNSLKKQIEQLKSEKRDANLQAALNAAAKAPANQGSDKICYLTFDDGPSDNTLQILNILKKYHVKATFFVVNTSKIDYIKYIYADGHTVGLHTASHKYDVIYKSVDDYFNDLNAIGSIVEGIIGVKSKVIRFPGGTSNGVSKDYCQGIMTELSTQVIARGYNYFDWNVASGDASGGKVPSATIVSNVVNQSKNKKQICVLMHDAHDKSTTVLALEDIIGNLILEGFRFEALTSDVQVASFKHKANN